MLSPMATYNELMRNKNCLINNSCEEEFLKFALNQEKMRQKWLASIQECQQLRSALDTACNKTAKLNRRLLDARRNWEKETHKCRALEKQLKSLKRQIAKARKLLFSDDLNDETREKLQFLNNTTLNRQSNTYTSDAHMDKLNTTAKSDSTGSILSDLNCLSKSEDDLETSAFTQKHKKREWKEHRPSCEFVAKQCRSAMHKVAELNSSDKIVATTTIVMPKDGTITASSTIEAVPGDENADPQVLHSSRKRRRSSTNHSNRSKLSHVEVNDIPIDTAPLAPAKADVLTSISNSEDIFEPSPNIGGYTFNTKMSRNHCFVTKTVIKSEICTPCGKRIRFGKIGQCRDCRATAHIECKNLVPLPCVPVGNTPTLRGKPGTIADYTPTLSSLSPMVPSIVVHCTKEVECRGMNEQGLYREPGSIVNAKILKEKFLKGKGAPNLSNIEIRTICSTLKDFLKSLREPLITVGLLKDFVHATMMTDKQDATAALYQAISELPKPNRDTLAHLMLHLQKVLSSSECKMSISNLATVFGPTLVGYSSAEPLTMLSETEHQIAIVENLLQIPSDYWDNIMNRTNLNDDACTPKVGELRYTPCTESLLKHTTSHFFNTPLTSSRSFAKRNKKYFATPPSRAGF